MFLCPVCLEIYEEPEVEYTLLRFCIVAECSGRILERCFRKWSFEEFQKLTQE